MCRRFPLLPVLIYIAQSTLEFCRDFERVPRGMLGSQLIHHFLRDLALHRLFVRRQVAVALGTCLREVAVTVAYFTMRSTFITALCLIRFLRRPGGSRNRLGGSGCHDKLHEAVDFLAYDRI